MFQGFVMTKEVILIVDDEEGIRESLSGIFEDEGYEVVTAASGEEALDIIKENMPYILLLDVLASRNGRP